jgi:hypothetical protein
MVGREAELERTIQVLCRRVKNNPIHVGDAGVGKTALTEGLAQRIVSGNVPEFLRDFTLYSLDMGAVVAGTKFRGDFEERIKRISDELQKKDVSSCSLMKFIPLLVPDQFPVVHLTPQICLNLFFRMGGYVVLVQRHSRNMHVHLKKIVLWPDVFRKLILENHLLRIPLQYCRDLNPDMKNFIRYSIRMTH